MVTMLTNGAILFVEDFQRKHLLHSCPLINVCCHTWTVKPLSPMINPVLNHCVNLAVLSFNISLAKLAVGLYYLHLSSLCMISLLLF